MIRMIGLVLRYSSQLPRRPPHSARFISQTV